MIFSSWKSHTHNRNQTFKYIGAECTPWCVEVCLEHCSVSVCHCSIQLLPWMYWFLALTPNWRKNWEAFSLVCPLKREWIPPKNKGTAISDFFIAPASTMSHVIHCRNENLHEYCICTFCMLDLKLRLKTYRSARKIVLRWWFHTWRSPLCVKQSSDWGLNLSSNSLGNQGLY